MKSTPINIFSRYFLLIGIPIIAVFLFLEFSLRSIPNDYKFKNKWLTENAHDVRIISFGASNGYFGINPVFFKKKAFNAAHLSQSLKYDDFLARKFVPSCDSLEFIILALSDLSMFYSLEDTEESWRIKNYILSYHCNYHRFAPKYNILVYGNNFSMIFPRLTNYYFKGVTELYCNELGFGLKYSHEQKPKDLEKRGEEAAKRHARIKNDSNYNENLGYLNNIIEIAGGKNVQVILLMTPSFSSYTANLDHDQLEKTIVTFTGLQRKYENVIFLDMTDDKRFTEEDFWDGDHLDEIGAEKLTRILDDTLSIMPRRLRKAD